MEENMEGKTKNTGYLNLYSKKELLIAQRFRKDRDILNAVLEDSRKYTIRDAAERVKRYKEGKVRGC